MAKSKSARSAAGAGSCSSHSVCGRCGGLSLVLVGLLIAANSLWTFVDVWLLIAVLLALKGLLMVLKPHGCGCCK